MSRDWINVATVAPEPANLFGRILLRSPHEIGVVVAHEAITYGKFLDEFQDGYIAERLRHVIFTAVRDTITESTIA